jgi:hypothetical protein
MHDTESDTFVYKSWPEKFSDMLKEIGVDSESKEIGTDEIAQTPRMVTNKGCIDVKNSNIDAIQIIQKG